MGHKKSSLFRDPNRVGKGDWKRKCDLAKLREGLAPVCDNHVVKPGRTTYKYVDGKMVEA